MRKSILSLSTSVALAMPAIAAAQLSAPPGPTPVVAGNLTLVSEYRLRGIDQTFGKPALQGGFDYSHASGAYVGNWNSNVNQGAGYPGGNLEMDFYGGYKRAFGDFGLDVGFLYYYYPGTDAGATSTPVVRNNRTIAIHSGAVNNKELYVGGTWKFLSLKYFHSLGDYFSVPDTKNTGYLDFAANYDLGKGWAMNAHYGHLNFKGVDNGSYGDWKLGVTKDLSGWVFGASYIGTNAKGDCGAGEPYCFSNGNGTMDNKRRDAGRSTVVVSVGKAF